MKKVLHIKSKVVENNLPKLPNYDQILYGEIAINYKDGYETLSIRNDADEVVTFSCDNSIIKLIRENSIVPSSGLTKINDNEVIVKLGDYLKFDQNSGITLIVDDELDSGSTNPISNSAITKVIYDNELVVSSALNDLEENKQNKLVAGNGISISDDVISYTGESQSVTAGSGVTITNGSVNVKLSDDLKFDSNSALSVNTDSQLSLTSNKPISNSAVTSALNAKQDAVTFESGLTANNGKVSVKLGSGLSFDTNSGITVNTDNALSTTSNNLVPNSVITNAINSKQNSLNVGSGVSITNDTINVKLGNGISFDANSALTVDSMTIDDELNIQSTNPVSNSAITQAILDNEEVTSSALNDLKLTKQDVLTAGNGISIANNVVSYTGQSQSLNAGSGVSIVNDTINVKLGDGIAYDANSALTVNVSSQFVDATGDTMSGKLSITNGGLDVSGNTNINGTLSATSINTPNLSITNVSGTTVKGSTVSATTYNNLPTATTTNFGVVKVGSGINVSNGTISVDDEYENVIETVKVNNATVTPDANKTINIEVPTSLSDLTSDATHRLVTDTEKSTWNGKVDKANAISGLSLSLNTTDYKLTLSGTRADGTNFTVSDVVDLPLESVVVGGSYNDATKKVILTLQNGSTIDFSVADLISGLQTEITSTNKLSADLISDGTTNKTVTATEKNTWNNKQDTINDLAGIRSGAALGATSIQTSGGTVNGTLKVTTISATTYNNLPTATTTNFGVVKVGNGLDVTNGTISVDGDYENTIETVKVNGTALTPDANKAVNVEVPTKVSDLTNDSGFITGYTETDPTVPAWAKQSTKPTYTASEVGALPDTTVIPTALSALTADATHRVVTDTEKSTWNNKQDKLTQSSGITIDTNNKVSVKLGDYLKFNSNSAITVNVDGTLNSGSTNPISNKVVTEALNNLDGKIDDANEIEVFTITQNGNNFDFTSDLYNQISESLNSDKLTYVKLINAQSGAMTIYWCYRTFPTITDKIYGYHIHYSSTNSYLSAGCLELLSDGTVNLTSYNFDTNNYLPLSGGTVNGTLNATTISGTTIKGSSISGTNVSGGTVSGTTVKGATISATTYNNLPSASTTTFGVVKVGNGLGVSNGVISVTDNFVNTSGDTMSGKLSVTSGGIAISGASTFKDTLSATTISASTASGTTVKGLTVSAETYQNLPTASSSEFGIMKMGTGLSGNNGTVAVSNYNNLATRGYPSKTAGVPIEIGKWCKVAKLASYGSVLLSVYVGQSSQSIAYTFNATNSYNYSSLYQLSHGNYTGHQVLGVRLTREGTTTTNFEVYLPYGAGGATSVTIYLASTSLSSNPNEINTPAVTPYTAITAGASSGATNDTEFTVSDTVDINYARISARYLRSTVAEGTQPIVVSSTTMCVNLNADMLDGYHATDLSRLGWVITSNASTSETGCSWFEVAVPSSNSALYSYEIITKRTSNNRPLIEHYKLDVFRYSDTSVSVSLINDGANYLYGNFYKVCAAISDDGKVYVQHGSTGASSQRMYIRPILNLGTVSNTPVGSNSYGVASGFTAVGTVEVTGYIRVDGTSVAYSGATKTLTPCTRLAESRTLWGQSFNGEENVSGDMTDVGSIDASGDITVTKSGTSSATMRVVNENGAVSLLASVNRGVYDSEASKWVVGTNGTNTFLMDGNVGINTTSPSYQLHVSGDTKSNRYRFSADTTYIGATKTQAWFTLSGVSGTQSPLIVEYTTGGTLNVRRSGNGIGSATTLGTSNYRWANVYSVSGNFSGNVVVSGDVTAKGAMYSSDRRLKENIEPISVEEINKLDKVDVVKFNFKTDDEKRTKYGVIAQDVEEAGLGNLVSEDENGSKSVDYISLLMLQIEKLNRKIDDMEKKHKQEIDELKNKIDELSSKK